MGRLGIRHRFASALNIYANPPASAFWRTLKDTASFRLHRPVTIQDLERRLEIALGHYLVFHPHQGLLHDTRLPRRPFRALPTTPIAGLPSRQDEGAE